MCVWGCYFAGGSLPGRVRGERRRQGVVVGRGEGRRTGGGSDLFFSSTTALLFRLGTGESRGRVVQGRGLQLSVILESLEIQDAHRPRVVP